MGDFLFYIIVSAIIAATDHPRVALFSFGLAFGGINSPLSWLIWGVLVYLIIRKEI